MPGARSRVGCSRRPARRTASANPHDQRVPVSDGAGHQAGAYTDAVTPADHRARRSRPSRAFNCPTAEGRVRRRRRVRHRDLTRRSAPDPDAPTLRPTDLHRHACSCGRARRIPRGRVATYGDVAALAGRPRAARAVGNIMRTAAGRTCRATGSSRRAAASAATAAANTSSALCSIAEGMRVARSEDPQSIEFADRGTALAVRHIMESDSAAIRRRDEARSSRRQLWWPAWQLPPCRVRRSAGGRHVARHGHLEPSG